jgi:hypothetical protein
MASAHVFPPPRLGGDRRLSAVALLIADSSQPSAFNETGVVGDGPAKGIMSDNYIIELHSGPAGIVVRDGRQYRFFAASHAFNALDGQLFKTPKDAEKAALRQASVPSRTQLAADTNRALHK